MVFILIPWFSPAFKAGGPIQSMAGMGKQPTLGKWAIVHPKKLMTYIAESIRVSGTKKVTEGKYNYIDRINQLIERYNEYHR